MRLSLVISVALLASCGDHEIAELQLSKQLICACQTAACTDVMLKTLPQIETKASHRTQVIAREILDCVAKVYRAERPSTDPDRGSAQ